MTRYKWYQSIGICPICHKERLLIGEKRCFTCSERAHDKTTSEIMSGKNREVMRRKYARIKASGMCSGCRKRPARPGRTQCAICAARNAEKARLRYAEGRA